MASSLVELYFAYQETKGAIVREERATALAAAAKIEEFAWDIERRVRETTRAASDDPAAAQLGMGKLAFRGGLGAALTEQRELDFLRLLRDVPAISELGHLDVSGKEQLRVSRLRLDAVGSQEDFAQAPKFLETRSGKTYWSPVYFRNGVEPYLTLAVPVGQYAVEVTTAEISLKAVQQAIAQIHVGRGGYAYVVDSRGRLFAHPEIALVRQNRDLSALPQVRDAKAAPGAAAASDIAMVAEGLQGGQILAAHAPIAPLGWLVLVERPLADAYAPLRAPILRSAVIFVLGLGLSILASILLARRMVAPIRTLQQGASRIGAGDLGHRVDVRTGDELEALGQELNRTAEQLEESYASLEQKVEARTRELAAANAGLTEALEQQTATSEILRVISSSPTDLQPIFDAIAERAMQLCGGRVSGVLTFDGELVHIVAMANVDAEGAAALRSVFPMRPSLRSGSSRAILTRAIVHIPDVLAEQDYQIGPQAQSSGFRSVLSVPMLRDGNAIGTVTIGRPEPGRYSERQIALVQTFADQAVIAIENVRLFKELEARNRDLTETLEQQTATSEILRIISSSPTDIQPVFDSIAESVVRLCGAEVATVTRFDGEWIHIGAVYGSGTAGIDALRATFPMRPSGAGGAARAIRDRAVAHIPDVLNDAEYRIQGAALTAGFRSVLGVPMLREGNAIGAITLGRAQPGEYTAAQIQLLRTFADQAVIAVENVRLFTELQAKNQAITEAHAQVTEALEQQTATAEILRVISSSPTDVQPIFDAIVASAVRLCDASFGGVLRFDGELLHIAAEHNVAPERLETFRSLFPMRPTPDVTIGRAILERAAIHFADVFREAPNPTREAARKALGYRAFLSVPMLRDGTPLGVIFCWRPEPRAFTEKQIALVRTFADQAVIAIENVRLFKELEARNRALTETLEQQTATGEILRVISSSPTDVRPVFDAIVRNARKLCEADSAGVLRYDGELIHMESLDNASPERESALRQAYPMPANRGHATGRAVLTGRPVHIPDVREDPDYALGTLRDAGITSVLSVPLLRDGAPIGAITVHTWETPRPFSDKQIALLQTFADQAVIAIENVRLFKELEARTEDLTRSVGELRALGEVSQAVSSTLDLEAVLETIVGRAVELSGSYAGIVYEFDETAQVFRARATHHITDDYLEVLRGTPLRLGEGAMGRAGVSREPVQVADIADERQLVASQVRALLVRQGMRSLLALPLVREGRLLGGLVIIRRKKGVFSPERVATLRTFAAQSVLAIHNAGLFRELQRQKQYSDALVETSPVAIATMDLDGNVVGWNPGAERLFGYTPAEALGHRMEDLVAPPEARDEIRANIRKTLEGEWIRAIARRARKDGTPVDVELSSMPVIVDGAKVGMIGIYHDITELLRARREAEAANEAKSAFLATMSHEIRTPLNAVIGMSGLLLTTPLSDEQREFAEVVRQSGDALLTVINDILDFSKIEAGRLELESHPFDLRECVEGALDLIATRAAEKGLDLAYQVGDGTPAGIVGDVTRLRQILLNLLSNAVKFTEHGEVVLSVTASPLEGAGGLHELTFSVRDTGIGIPADRADRLFQSFSQVDASTTRRYGGTGLGLAISQRLAELMGGRISVTSEVGAGSDFRFTIRAATADVPATTRRDLSGIQPSLREKRVLVVDDNATNRRILTTHLHAWGMQARATGSPLEALGWVQAGEAFDVGILDMHMPEMDGVALAHAIAEEPAGAALPLVLFTSLGRREARADSEGFAAYLHKPIKPSQLFDALVSVLADQTVHVRERVAARSELDADLARRHPLRILLAEDNVVNQKVALRLLGQMGYRADVASNGLEAIDAVARQTYDVVLMDVQMPELDGFEASREINRRWPGERRPRIVAMTANALQGDRELCIAAGMDDYVAKPIRVDELVAALARCRRREAGAGYAPADERVGSSATPKHAAVAPDRGAPPAGRTAGGAADGPVDRATFARLTAQMGGPFVAELIDTFRADAGELIATLRRALGATDLDAFRRAAHSLKSTSESLGAGPLAALARELENGARAGSLEGAAPGLEQLVGQYAIVTQTLEELRRDLPA
jgi:PAS domain S-box-containing protein